MKLVDYLKVIESNQARIGAQVHRFSDHGSSGAEAGADSAPEGATLLEEALAGHYRQMCRDLEAVDRAGSESIAGPRAAPAIAAGTGRGEDR